MEQPVNLQVSAEKRAEILHEHYKDSVQHLDAMLKVRFQIAILIFVIVTLMVFQGTDPKSATSIFTALISETAKTPPSSFNLDPRFIGSLLWFLLASLTAQMYGRSLLIEIRADQLRSLEAELTNYVGAEAIRWYREKRPTYLRRASFFYFLGFVILVVGVVVAKGILEFKIALHEGFVTRLFAAYDLLMAFVIFYLSYIFGKDYQRIQSKLNIS